MFIVLVAFGHVPGVLYSGRVRQFCMHNRTYSDGFANYTGRPMIHTGIHSFSRLPNVVQSRNFNRFDNVYAKSFLFTNHVEFCLLQMEQPLKLEPVAADTEFKVALVVSFAFRNRK